MSTVTCPSCTNATPAGFPRCAHCGAELAAPPSSPREERKVVTVLFCDLVGFTQRSEQLDPEDVRALLSGYHAHLRAELERFGGTVEKFIGDAVVAVFGAPVAHDVDPERAVRAALAVRDWATEQEGLELRIAVNTGEALVTLGADPARGEGMVAGDVVNTAARLQAAAPANGVLVGESTYRATRDRIDYRDAEPVEAKGKKGRVAVWEAVAARARIGVERLGGTPLVGREQELTLLRETLARVKREREPQLLTLVGVPGIGKSRLVYELFRSIEEGSQLVSWRRGGSLPYGEGVAFWALGEIVKAEAGILETDGPAQVEEKLARAVATVVEDTADAAWVERHLRPLLALEAEASVGADRRGEAFAAWRRFLEALAERRLLVLVFEDLHWADEALLDFVDHLADWARGVPLLVLATARPELLARRAGWGGGKVNSATVLLSPLSDNETAELVHELLQRAVVDADVRTQLLEHAGGNPLYAEEFVRMQRERPGAAKLPESVQGIIAARLDGLPPEEKELLQDAAVIGRVFWLGALGTERWTLEERLHALGRKELVRRERRSSVAGESEYTFGHALVRDVAYEQIPRAQRAEKHRAAASWIESLGRPDDHAEMLAHHYLRALDYTRAAGRPDEHLVAPARAALQAAGERALALNAFASAGRLLATAVELDGAGADAEAALVLSLATALHRAGDERAEEVLERAIDAALATGDREGAAVAHMMLAELWWHRGNRRRADEHLRPARALVHGISPSPATARVLASVSRFLALGGQNDEAIAVGRDALAGAEELALEEVRAQALNNIGMARFQQGDVGGLADLERSVDVAGAANSPEAARAYNNLAACLMQFGDLERGMRLREEAVRVAERYGDVRTARFSRAVVVNQAYIAGRWGDHVRGTAARLAQSAELGRSYQDVYVLAYGAMVKLARGDAPAASDDAHRALEFAREAGDPQTLVPALAVLAFLEQELGRTADAIAYACEALAVEGVLFSSELATLALVADRLGVVQEFAGVVERTRPTRWADALESALARDFARAADLLGGIGHRPAAAYARLRAGEALAADGRRREADAQLEQALAFWRSVGATRYVERAERLLERVA